MTPIDHVEAERLARKWAGEPWAFGANMEKLAAAYLDLRRLASEFLEAQCGPGWYFEGNEKDPKFLALGPAQAALEAALFSPEAAP